MRIVREIFRRGNDYVAVRPVRLSADTVIEPGEDIDKELVPMFLLRSLYRRRRIGVKGSLWAEAMLADSDNAKARPERTGGKAETSTQGNEKPKAKAKAAPRKKAAVNATTAPAQEPEKAPAQEPVKEPEKVSGADATQPAWLSKK